ncbi:MAG: hypothetical protein M3P18_03585 [Actinomycetota bacterium]|nr:hypothetical protein [Actinomycetota bacterium]
MVTPVFGVPNWSFGVPPGGTMGVMKRMLVVAVLAAAWLAQPTTAYAHVGRSPSVAVDDRARITRIEPPNAPFDVRVVDGDQDLWLQLKPGNDLVVLGASGEPFLRFHRGAVFANTRSPTAQSDLFGVIPARSTEAPPTPPSWWKVSSGASYLWHDHRLHALALLSGVGPPRKLGQWHIPLRLNGRRAVIVGGLWSVSGPQRWFWLMIPLVILAGALTILRFGGAPLIRMGGATLGAITAVAVVIARAGRDLYGRPEVTTGRYVSLGIALALGVLALDRLVRARQDAAAFIGMIVGVIGLVEGLTLLPTFWNAVVLAAIPSWLERLCAALALGAGTASLIYSFAGTTEDLNQPIP